MTCLVPACAVSLPSLYAYRQAQPLHIHFNTGMEEEGEGTDNMLKQTAHSMAFWQQQAAWQAPPVYPPHMPGLLCAKKSWL